MSLITKITGRQGRITVTLGLLLGAIVAFPAALFADTLILKSGQKYENVTITGMDRTMIRFTEKGSRRSIAKRNLEKIVYSNEADQLASIQSRDRELARLQQQIRDLSDDRDSYLAKKVEEAGGLEDSLDRQIFEAVRKQAGKAGLEYEDGPSY